MQGKILKKIVGILSVIIEFIGVSIIGATISIIDNYILFYIGIGMVAVGIIGAFYAGEEIKKIALSFFDWI